jgi:acyl carrier protein
MEIQSDRETMPTVLDSTKRNTEDALPKQPPTAVEIQAWIVAYLAELLEIDPDEINTTISFDRYGLDSSVAVGLTGDLEDWMETKLDPTLLYDYPTIESLAQHLAENFI